LSYPEYYSAAIGKSKNDGGKIMESSRYWRVFSGAGAEKFIESYYQRRAAVAAILESGRETVTYDGRVLSLEDYLAVPTFVRQGKSIAV